MMSSSKESEWELRDGKFYKKMSSTIATDVPKTSKMECPNCPQHVNRIQLLTKEIAEFRMRLERLEREQKMWQEERSKLINLLKERDAEILKLKAMLEERIKIIKSKEVIIIKMQQRIKELEEALAKSGGNQVHLIKEKETLIIKLQQRLKELEDLLAEKGELILKLQKRIHELEEDSSIKDLLKEKEQLILEFQTRIQNLENQLKDKDETIRKLEIALEQRDADNNDLRSRLESMLAEMQELQEAVQYCQTNHLNKPAINPPVVETRWYYAVQNQKDAQSFQNHPRYQGGSLVVESLDGATVVDPDYFTIAERVPGQSRLRIRVVEATDISLPWPNAELFIRLKLGTGVQFTQPRAVTSTSLAWNQDFLFVSVPLKPHPAFSTFAVSSFPLVIEAVIRQVGTAPEQVIASAVVDLQDLITGLTRVSTVLLNEGGVLNLRIKALDFGLPNKAEYGEFTNDSTVRVGDINQARTLDMLDGVLDGKMGFAPIRLQKPNGNAVRANNLNQARSLDMADGVLDGRIGNVPIRLQNGGNIIRAGDLNQARRLDMADGVLDGHMGDQQIRLQPSGSRIIKAGDLNKARQLDMADGVLDGCMGDQQIRLQPSGSRIIRASDLDGRVAGVGVRVR